MKAPARLLFILGIALLEAALVRPAPARQKPLPAIARPDGAAPAGPAAGGITEREMDMSLRRTRPPRPDEEGVAPGARSGARQVPELE